MNPIQWNILKYLRHPVSLCFDCINMDCIMDVLTESMYQYHERMNRDFTVKRPKYFIDNRQYIVTTLIPSLSEYFDEQMSFENKPFYKHLREIVIHEYVWVCTSCDSDKDYCDCENNNFVITMCSNNMMDVLDFPSSCIIDTLQPLDWSWYNHNLCDWVHDEIRYKYHKWKHMTFESPCKLLGYVVSSRTRFLYMFPRYFFN